MNTMQITEQLQRWTEEFLKDTPDYFLVGIKIKPGNNIQVFADADK